MRVAEEIAISTFSHASDLHLSPRSEQLSGERTLDVSGVIDTDTVWDADTVRVQGDVEVADNTSLTISSGVRVEFQDYYSLTIRGQLLALGRPDDQILFTSHSPESFAFDSSLAGAWAGIRFPFISAANDPSRLEYCIIEYAKNAGDSLRGGALQVNGFSELLLQNSILRNNAADFGGAIASTHFASPEFKDCLIVENVAFRGGSALHCVDAFPRLTNCTIVANDDQNPNVADPAAAIYPHMSRVHVIGTILRDNLSNSYEPTQILYGKSYYTTWSNIGDGWTGEGVIDVDPMFLGGGAHPYSLQDGSPCVNTGPPDSTGLNLPQLDLAGSERFQGGRVDIGSYEGNPGTGSVVDMPGNFLLRPNHPNPFNSATTTRFCLTMACPARVTVSDLRGRLVKVLVNDIYEAGLHEVAWDGTDKYGRAATSGVYLLRLEAGQVSESRKLVLLRR